MGKCVSYEDVCHIANIFIVVFHASGTIILVLLRKRIISSMVYRLKLLINCY